MNYLVVDCNCGILLESGEIILLPDSTIIERFAHRVDAEMAAGVSSLGPIDTVSHGQEGLLVHAATLMVDIPT